MSWLQRCRMMLALLVCWCSFALQGLSQTAFRIDTDIYEDMTKPPVMRSKTIFSEGVCYDFDNTDIKLITVIDLGRQRIFLLNPTKEQKAEIRMADLEVRLADATKELSEEQKATLVNSHGIERDESSGDLIIRNKQLEYRCSMQKAKNADVASTYCQFADWSARLNALYPPHWPPYLRIELNAAVAADNSIPKELQKIIRNGNKERRLTAKILPNWRLSSEDQTLIVRTGAMLVQYQSIGVDQFIKEMR